MRLAVPVLSLTWALIALTAEPAAADERVGFDSARYIAGTLQQRIARERGEMPTDHPATPLIGYLAKPDGAGPFPAIVHLHGCTGLTERLRQSTAARMTGWGYVSLVVDSFATRGIADDCVTAPADRHADAMGALAYLATLSFVDPRRIALIGHAQGGAAGRIGAELPPVRHPGRPRLPRRGRVLSALQRRQKRAGAADADPDRRTRRLVADQAM